VSGYVYKVGGNVRDALMGSYSQPHFKVSDDAPKMSPVIERRPQPDVSEPNDAALGVFLRVFGVTEDSS
jgi:tRNA nucleotidyltransferase/poly(A) polymerase